MSLFDQMKDAPVISGFNGERPGKNILAQILEGRVPHQLINSMGIEERLTAYGVPKKFWPVLILFDVKISVQHDVSTFGHILEMTRMKNGQRWHARAAVDLGTIELGRDEILAHMWEGVVYQLMAAGE